MNVNNIFAKHIKKPFGYISNLSWSMFVDNRLIDWFAKLTVLVTGNKIFVKHSDLFQFQIQISNLSWSVIGDNR